MSAKRSRGQASTQSPQAVHFSGSTTGRATALIVIASNVQATAQAARPTPPHPHALPPPPPAAPGPVPPAPPARDGGPARAEQPGHDLVDSARVHAQVRGHVRLLL